MATTLRDAILHHRRAAGFADDGGKSLAYDWLTVGPVSVPIPNPDWRKRVIIYHDVSHLLSGYGTDWRGELDEGAYECGAGMGFFTPAWGFNLQALAGGTFVRPVSTWRAFLKGRASTSVYIHDMDVLLERPVDEVRRELVGEAMPATAADVGVYLVNLTAGLALLAAQALVVVLPVAGLVYALS